MCVYAYIYIWRQCIIYIYTYIYCKKLQFQLFFYSGFLPFVHTYVYKHIYIWYIIYIYIYIYAYMYICIYCGRCAMCSTHARWNMKGVESGLQKLQKHEARDGTFLSFLIFFCWCQSLRNYTYTYTYPYPDADWYTYNVYMYMCIHRCTRICIYICSITKL